MKTFLLIEESQKSSDDHECLADPEMVRLQLEMESERLRRSRSVVRAFGSYLVARYRFV